MGKPFPKSFIWGTATSSFQVEGNLHLGDRGPSIWDDCENKLQDHSHLLPGADGLNHIDEDIALLKELGVTAYRMSLSWTRIIPTGDGKPSSFGINLYREIFAKLLSNGITPYVTIFHWDYPKALEERGGWLNPDSVKWFVHYCEVVGEAFDGLISHYFIMNEPECFVELGYFTGEKAPYKKLPRRDVLIIAHNAMKAAAIASRRLREVSHLPLKLGLALTYSAPYPADFSSYADKEAAYKATMAFTNRLFCLPYFADPSYLGEYPQNWMDGFDCRLSLDGEECLGDYDFFGLNIYNGGPVKASSDGFEFVKGPKERNSLGWGITPEAIRYAANFCYSRYHKPIFISENGVCLKDEVIDKQVHDANRSSFIDSYLLSLQKGMDEGADVRGYFYWSFLDNLEWENGYFPRFGLVYTDYAHKAKRIKKDSFYHYQKIIKDKKIPD
jgi:beta-glucosidase